jgi:hypothetical protein
MATLLEQLPKDIARLEAKYGPDNPFVKQQKEQLLAMLENSGKSTEGVFRLQAFNFSPPPADESNNSNSTKGEEP